MQSNRPRWKDDVVLFEHAGHGSSCAQTERDTGPLRSCTEPTDSMTTEGRPTTFCSATSCSPQGGGGAARDGLVSTRSRRCAAPATRSSATSSAACPSRRAHGSNPRRRLLRARRQRRTHLASVGVTAVSLANNHALDFGSVALLDTLDHLAAARSPRPARVPTSIGPGAARSCRRAGWSACSPRPTIRRSSAPGRTHRAWPSPIYPRGSRTGSAPSWHDFEQRRTSSPSRTGVPT